MLLAQAVPIIGQRLALGQALFGEGLDLIQRLEESERLRDGGLGLFFCPLTASVNRRVDGERTIRACLEFLHRPGIDVGASTAWCRALLLGRFLFGCFVEFNERDLTM